MARGKSADTKAMSLLADLMAKYGQEAGIENPDEVLENVKTVSELQDAESSRVRNAMAEVEGIIIQQHYAHSFQFKNCKYCKETFQTNYCYQSYCSPLCRDQALRQHLGLSVAGLRALRERKPASFWEYEEPITISPTMVESVYAFSKMFVEGYEEIKLRAAETPDQSPEDQPLDEEVLPFPPYSEEEASRLKAVTSQRTESLFGEIEDDVPQSTSDLPKPGLFDLDFDLDDEF